MVQERKTFDRVKSRKLYVWLISTGAVLVIYLLYNQLSSTPPIEIDTGAKFADTAAESNTVKSDSEIGMVGSVGVGTVQKAKYTHLNTKKQVDREFGFERLLYVEGDEWEIEKPYMNVFRGNLKCYMTADVGKVQVEDAVGKATPKDATLTGNVVVHILPEKGSKIKEGFIYLDDIIFISEKSQFSSAGPVRFTSQDAQMLGKGLEIVYNDELDRLEYLKIIALESLRIRQSSKASMFSSKERGDESPTTGVTREGEQTEKAVESATAEDRQKTKEIPAADKGAIEKKKGAYYKCVLRKNVIIDGPEQLVFADEVSIDNLLWSKGPEEKYENKNSDTDKMGTTVEANEESVTSPPSEPNKPSKQSADIVVTCDNGIIVMPMDSSEMPEDASATENKVSKSFDDKSGRPTFIAKRIDYCAVTEDTVASGPSELTFYANDVTGTEGKPGPSERGEGKQPGVPVKITAREKAEFLPALNQVIFEGDVLCTMLREKADFQQKDALSSPKLTVDLSKDKQLQADIKHLTANGGVVQLDTSKWAGEKLLGFTKLKCLTFDYDADLQMFLAVGSGVIAVDNSKIAEPEKKVGKFSLQKPCYVVMRNFDTLKYFSKTGVIIADAGAEQILVDYFPIVQGQHGEQTSATANHIEAALYETASGQNELSTLSAKGGITYEEEKAKKGKAVQFVGSEMFYDGNKSMITAWGDDSQPCFLNGALAPGIEYDLKNDRIKTKITGPGMLQMGR
ncbi:MAG: hypothetical protein WAK60_02370 [Sedimentisphaerales bacterium]